jgi:hypothetical protein
VREFAGRLAAAVLFFFGFATPIRFFLKGPAYRKNEGLGGSRHKVYSGAFLLKAEKVA